MLTAWSTLVHGPHAVQAASLYRSLNLPPASARANAFGSTRNGYLMLAAPACLDRPHADFEAITDFVAHYSPWSWVIDDVGRLLEIRYPFMRHTEAIHRGWYALGGGTRRRCTCLHRPGQIDRFKSAADQREAHGRCDAAVSKTHSQCPAVNRRGAIREPISLRQHRDSSTSPLSLFRRWVQEPSKG